MLVNYALVVVKFVFINEYCYIVVVIFVFIDYAARNVWSWLIQELDVLNQISDNKLVWNSDLIIKSMKPWGMEHLFLQYLSLSMYFAVKLRYFAVAIDWSISKLYIIPSSNLCLHRSKVYVASIYAYL